MSGGNGHSGYSPLTEDHWLKLVGRITSACLIAGLSRPDAEDLAQDVITWLVTSGSTEMALVSPWLTAVTQNFLRRYLRSRWRESRLHFAVAGAQAPTDLRQAAGLEAKLFLERLASRSPDLERRLIQLMGAGHRLSEAAKEIGIAHGSEQHHMNRIRARARTLGKARVPPPG
jgi:DNA-directed RNA polymerase specialized sigma24 family protein